MKGRSGKRKSARIEGQQQDVKTEVKAGRTQAKRRTQHGHPEVARPSEARNEDNDSLPSEPDSSGNSNPDSLHVLMLKTMEKVDQFTDWTTELNENVVGLQSDLINTVRNHDHRINFLEGRVRVIEQRDRGNENPMENPDPVHTQPQPGRAVCRYCQKDLALSYVYAHQKRYHAEEVRRNRARL